MSVGCDGYAVRVIYMQRRATPQSLGGTGESSTPCLARAICHTSPNPHTPPRPTLHKPSYTPEPPPLLPPPPQPRLPNHTPRNNPPYPRAHTHQHARPDIPTVHQNLQRRDIIRNHRPANRRSTARQIVLPDNQQDREELRTATNQQRGAKRRGVRVVRYQTRIVCP